MTYCLHPTCQKPQNSADAKFCKSCGRNLLLGDRYRPIELKSHEGDRRIFIAIDERKPSQPKCTIQQFILPESTNLAKSSASSLREKATALLSAEAVKLNGLGKHPQIPQLLAFFPQDPYPCWVKEFIEGKNLTRELKENGLFNEAQIRSLLNELLPVLQFTHSKQLIHQDVNPANIIRPKKKGALVLVGFAADKLAIANFGLIWGSSNSFSEYAAPEQTKGGAVFASDLYSLGVTCLYLLTGKSPKQLYDNSKDVWVWRNYLGNNSVSPQLGRLLDRIVARKISDRYQSAAEVLEDVQNLPNFLYFDLDSLSLERKRFLAKQGLSSVIPGKDIIFRQSADSMSGREITEKIYEKLTKFSQAELGKKSIREEEIVLVWGKYASRIVSKMSVPLEWQYKKNEVASEIKFLAFIQDHEERKKKLEAIAKDILLLVFEIMTEKEKIKFIEKVVEEAAKQQVQIESRKLTSAQIENMLEGTVGSPSLAMPIISKIIIERLSQGFLIPILAFLGIQPVRNFGILAEPIGWGLIIVATLGSGVSALSIYRKERKKVLFIQMFFCIYTYSLNIS